MNNDQQNRISWRLSIILWWSIFWRVALLSPLFLIFGPLTGMILYEFGFSLEKNSLLVNAVSAGIGLALGFGFYLLALREAVSKHAVAIRTEIGDPPKSIA